MSVLDFFRLDGSTAIVTGGGRGLGAYMARGLAEAGANVVVCSRRKEACDEVADEIRNLGRGALALACDVSREEEVEAVVERAVERFGGVDVLINNSGITWGAPALEMPADKVSRVLEVNVTGTFLMSRAVARRLIDREASGSIVNIASVAAFLGSKPGNIEAVGYNASKGGVVSLTRALAGSWAGHGIRVNAIAPGWFPTRMSRGLLDARGESFLEGIPLGRFGGEDDIKGVALFLASRASAYMTGETIVVDGGQAIW